MGRGAIISNKGERALLRSGIGGGIAARLKENPQPEGSTNSIRGMLLTSIEGMQADQGHTRKVKDDIASLSLSSSSRSRLSIQVHRKFVKPCTRMHARGRARFFNRSRLHR